MAATPVSGTVFEVKPAAAKRRGAVSEATRGTATWEEVGPQGIYEVLENVDTLEVGKLVYNVVAM